MNGVPSDNGVRPTYRLHLVIHNDVVALVNDGEHVMPKTKNTRGVRLHQKLQTIQERLRRIPRPVDQTPVLKEDTFHPAYVWGKTGDHTWWGSSFRKLLPTRLTKQIQPDATQIRLTDCFDDTMCVVDWKVVVQQDRLKIVGATVYMHGPGLDNDSEQYFPVDDPGDFLCMMETLVVERWAPAPVPIPMLLYCPKCLLKHVDYGEWAARPHKTHWCANCHHEWRPANVHTVGVTDLPESP